MDTVGGAQSQPPYGRRSGPAAITSGPARPDALGRGTGDDVGMVPPHGCSCRPEARVRTDRRGTSARTRRRTGTSAAPPRPARSVPVPRPPGPPAGPRPERRHGRQAGGHLPAGRRARTPPSTRRRAPGDSRPPGDGSPPGPYPGPARARSGPATTARRPGPGRVVRRPSERLSGLPGRHRRCVRRRVRVGPVAGDQCRVQALHPKQPPAHTEPVLGVPQQVQ